MKALVFHGPKDIRYESFPDPKMGSVNGAILKVEHCSICGSDLHMYHGDQVGNRAYGEQQETFCTGHEFIGEVVETGSETHGFQVGDKVVCAGGTGCGECPSCLVGRVNECRKMAAFGMSAELQGGQAEYVSVPNADRTLLKIDDRITTEQAVLLTDAAATAYFGISRADITPGSTVAVVGLGPIGLIGVELAFLFGASQVIAVDPVETRRIAATRLGATAIPADENARRVVKAATNGRGADSVFEASGTSAAIDSVLPMIATGGTASFIGVPRPSATLSMQQLMFRNVTVRGGIADVQSTWPALLPLLASGRLKAQGLFTHHYDLSDGAEAFRLFDSRDDGVVKIMLDVG